MTESDNSQLLIAFGRMEAELQGLRDQATAHHVSVMRRMDDLDKAAHQRIDVIEDRVAVLERDNKHHFRQAGWGGAGGALVAGLIEMIRRVA